MTSNRNIVINDPQKLTKFAEEKISQIVQDESDFLQLGSTINDIDENLKLIENNLDKLPKNKTKTTEDVEKELKNWEEKYKSINENYKKIEILNEELKQENTNLIKTIEKNTAEIKKIKKSIEEQQKKINEVQDQKDEAIKKSNELETEKKSLKNKNRQLQKELEEKRLEIEQNDNQIQTIKTNYEKQVEEIKRNYNLEINSLKNQHQIKIKELDEKIEQDKKFIMQYNTNLQEQQIQYITLQKDYNDTKEELDEAKNKIKELEQQNKKKDPSTVEDFSQFDAFKKSTPKESKSLLKKDQSKLEESLKKQIEIFNQEFLKITAILSKDLNNLLNSIP